MKRVVTMIRMKVKKKGKRPNNFGNPKERMIPYLYLNHNHNHKPNTHILRWEALPPTRQMPFNACFLQSFYKLHVEVTGFQERYNEICHDINRMFGHMESIEEGVTYFGGYTKR